MTDDSPSTGIIHDWEKSFSQAMETMQYLTRGDSIGIHDAYDLAMDGLIEFDEALRSGRPMNDPTQYFNGILRNKYRQRLREKYSAPSRSPLIDVPYVNAASEDSTLAILDDYHAAFRAGLSKTERALLPDLLDPQGRKLQEIAAEHGMKPSALSEARKRMTIKAEFHHISYTRKLFFKIFPTADYSAQTDLLALARTPQERADYRLRLAHGCMAIALQFKRRTADERVHLIAESRRHLSHVKMDALREQSDPRFRVVLNLLQITQVRMDELSAPSRKDRIRLVVRHLAEIGDYRIALHDKHVSACFTAAVYDPIRFLSLGSDIGELAKPFSERAEKADIVGWKNEFTNQHNAVPEAKLSPDWYWCRLCPELANRLTEL